MSFNVNPVDYWARAAGGFGGVNNPTSFWSQNNDKTKTDDVWNFFSSQCDVKVNMCLEKVARKLVLDLADLTADYLVDKPGLSEDYVLVIVDDPVNGREARAYRRNDLVAGLDSPRREEVLEALDKNPLLYHTSVAELPAGSDDPELAGLAAQAQAFLDQNDKLLNILTRQGLTPWLENALFPEP